MIEDPAKLRLRRLVRKVQLTSHRSWLRAMAKLRGTDEPPRNPIFLVGCPRSGTTLLFRLLRRHEAVASLHGEGHVLWNTYQHPKEKGWTSDRATDADVKPGERRFIYSSIRSFVDGGRFLDKTPKNVLKIPYLFELFPDARFVLLKRDGRDTVNSLIEGWEVRHGVSYKLPQRLNLAEYRGRYWSYVLPPGWRELANTSIAEIAALQYTTSYEQALADIGVLPREALLELKFEDLLERPLEETRRLLEFLGLKASERVTEMAGNLSAHPVQTTSPPEAGKWRKRSDQIAAVAPKIIPIMSKLGYEVASTL
jgi:hypothetical protein